MVALNVDIASQTSSRAHNKDRHCDVLCAGVATDFVIDRPLYHSSSWCVPKIRATRQSECGACCQFNKYTLAHTMHYLLNWTRAGDTTASLKPIAFVCFIICVYYLNLNDFDAVHTTYQNVLIGEISRLRCDCLLITFINPPAAHHFKFQAPHQMHTHTVSTFKYFFG